MADYELKNSLDPTLPKESRKELLRSEVTRDALSNRSAIASILLNKARMSVRKLAPRQQEDMEDDDTSALFKSASSRSKRRRLDHLTWEEKLQRKKMKNRVAAQTSRDRKKAKLDELEQTVKMLTQECIMLRSQNESLLNETKRLRKELDTKNREERYCTLCQARVHCVVPSLGSAVSPNDPLPQGGTAQSAARLTPTPGAIALLKILTIYLLLRNFAVTSRTTITSSDSRNSRRVYYEKLISKCKQLLISQMNKCPSRMIPMKNLAIQKQWWGRHQKMWKPIELVEATRSDAQGVMTNATTSQTTPSLAIKTEVEIKQESEVAHDLETTFYGTYDEATNSITIIYPGQEDADIGIQECVQEISTDDDIVCHDMDSTVAHNVTHDTVAEVTTDIKYLTPPPLRGYSTQFSPAYTCRTDTMSPASINSDTDSCVVPQMDSISSTDCGYESHDSPSVDSHCRYSYFNDFWQENFRDLFPALA